MSQRKPSLRVAIYCRISEDRSGEQQKVERQERDCRAFCKKHGHVVVDVHVDNDISASSYSRKKRPGFTALVEQVTAGQIEGIVTTHLDRLVRRPLELEGVIELADQVQILTLHSSDIDLSNPDGRMMGRFLAAVAANESERKGQRIRDATRANAEAGKFLGGSRPFGYEKDGLTVRESEAALIREAADRVLNGEGLHGIVKDFARRGVTSSTGRALNAQTFRATLISPRIAQLSVYKGKEKGAAPVVAKAQWGRIITDERHEELKAHFQASSDKYSDVPRGRVHLLSGLLTCDGCGERLNARPMKRKDGRSVLRYQCTRVPHKPQACGQMVIKAEPVDAYVTLAVIERLTNTDLRKAAKLGKDTKAKTEAARAVKRLDDQVATLEHDNYVMDAFATRQQQYKKLRAELISKLDKAKRDLLALDAGSVLSGLPSSKAGLEAAWLAKPLEWRRDLITASTEEIRIVKATKAMNMHTPPEAYFDRVKITYR